VGVNRDVKDRKNIQESMIFYPELTSLSQGQNLTQTTQCASPGTNNDLFFGGKNRKGTNPRFLYSGTTSKFNHYF